MITIDTCTAPAHTDADLAAADSTPESDRANGWERILPVLGLAALVVGLFLRALQYAMNRSLWLDEALLSASILDRSFSELLNPASWGPVPPAYILASKMATLSLGESELALRLVPFLAGMAALPVFWIVSQRSLGRSAGTIAFSMFALSPYLIYYSSEAKPYSSDVLAALLLTFFALHLAKQGLTGPKALGWLLVAILAATFSMTSVFVTAGATLALMIHFRAEQDRIALRWMALAGAAWILALGIPYFMFVAGAASNAYLQAFWQSGFMPLPPRSLADLAWFPKTFWRVLLDPLGVIGDQGSRIGAAQSAAGAIAMLTGVWFLSRKKTFLFALLVFPIGLALLASAVQVYPFGGVWASSGRLILFLVPGFFLIMAAGIEHFRAGAARRLRPLSFALLTLLIFPPLAWGLIAVPQPRAELKPLLEYVNENRLPEDVLYVHYDTRHAFSYYASTYGFTPEQYILGRCDRFAPQRYLTAMEELVGRNRIWLVFSGGSGAYRFDEKKLMLDYLDHRGVRIDDQVSHGVQVYLYDLSAPPHNSSPPFQVQIPVYLERVEEGCALWN